MFFGKSIGRCFFIASHISFPYSIRKLSIFIRSSSVVLKRSNSICILALLRQQSFTRTSMHPMFFISTLNEINNGQQCSTYFILFFCSRVSLINDYFSGIFQFLQNHNTVGYMQNKCMKSCLMHKKIY